MFDEIPEDPKPIELAASLARGDATDEECRLAARWMRDAIDAVKVLQQVQDEGWLSDNYPIYGVVTEALRKTGSVSSIRLTPRTPPV